MTFDGKSFKVSSSNPMGLDYCTSERAEGIAKKIRKLGVQARIVKKKWDGNRVAHVVYVYGMRENLM
jgi:hypothetical protein